MYERLLEIFENTLERIIFYHSIHKTRSQA